MAVSRSGRYVAGVGGGKSTPNMISVWQTSPPLLLWQAELPPPVRAILFSPTDNWLVVAHQGELVTPLVARNGTLVKRLKSPAGPVSSLALSADISTLVGGSSPNNAARSDNSPAAVIWNPFASMIKQALLGREGVCSLALTPDRKTLITGNDGGLVQLWNVRGGESKIKFDLVGTGVCAVTSAGQGVTVAGLDRNHVLTVWDANSGEVRLVHQLTQAGNVPPALSASGGVQLRGHRGAPRRDGLRRPARTRPQRTGRVTGAGAVKDHLC